MVHLWLRVAKGIRTPAVTGRNIVLPALSLRVVPIHSGSLPAVLCSALDGVKSRHDRGTCATSPEKGRGNRPWLARSPSANMCCMADESSIKTYSLEKVAAMVLPPEMKNGPRWLAHRLNRGELSGYRIGRVWRMTHDDIEDLIGRYRSRPRAQNSSTAELGAASAGLTPTSRRRRERGVL
jgi:hypothetical protein